MMQDIFQRHRPTVVLAGYVSFSLLCLSLHLGPYVQGLKTAVWFLFSPQVVYSGQFFNKLDSLTGRVFHLIHVEGENHILRQQNARLSIAEMERDALDEENARLRGLLGLRQKYFSDGVSAEILGVDMRNFFQLAVINKGAKDNIDIGAAVVALAGPSVALVGRVAEVKEKSSKIMYLTDILSAVSATLPRTGDVGLLEGHNKPWVSLNYLPQHSMVEPGDHVCTVGLGGLFPPNIPVGTVTAVTETADGFFKEARVLPYATPGSLREVYVLNRTELPGGGPKP